MVMMRIILMGLLLTISVWAESVSLNWDAVENDDILTYRVHWGYTSGEYPFVETVGAVTSWTLEGLRADVPYYVAVTAVDFWGNESDYSREAVINQYPSHEPEDSVHISFELKPNFPNPVNESTIIEYQLPRHLDVRLVIYNTLGQQVRVLQQGMTEPGTHLVNWDGTDHRGRQVPAGPYICRLESKMSTATRRLMLVR